MLRLLVIITISLFVTDASARKSSPDVGKAEPSASAETASSKADSAPEVSSASGFDTSGAQDSVAADEPPLITDPMRMQFRISRLERGVSPDSRLFTSPRVITLTAVGPIAHLNESVWRGKRLAVFHKTPVQVTRAGDDSSSDSVSIAFVEEKVGEIKIQSVYQATMQAVVSLDDITRGLAARKGEARVVMLGDFARLERPIKAAPKPKVRRYAKPKKRSPYERDDMRWRL